MQSPLCELCELRHTAVRSLPPQRGQGGTPSPGDGGLNIDPPRLYLEPPFACEDRTSNKEPTLPPVLSDPRWIQFRRLLLGTVIEALLKAEIAVDFPSIEIAFDAESDFRVPRFDNYMRFKGRLKANVTAAPSSAAQASLVRNLKEAWPSLLDALDLPVGDKLTSDRNEIEVAVEGQALTVRFDLEAD